MQYEIYADLLFLQYFGLNIILLWCLNRRFSYTATWGKLMLSAAMGALGATIGVLRPVPNLWSKLISFVGTVAMLVVSFPCSLRASAINFLKEVLVYSFYIGGGFLGLHQVCRLLHVSQGVLCFGMLLAGFGLILFAPGRATVQSNIGRVTLSHKGRTVETYGLIDTGNTLTEPISGKPVAVLDARLLDYLLGDATEGFRVIPYHSIGKEHGLLKGYCIEELQITIDGGSKRIAQIYLAAAPEGISFPEGYKGEKRGSKERIGLLLQPRILQ